MNRIKWVPDRSWGDDVAIVQYHAEGDGFQAWVFLSNTIGWYAKIEFDSRSQLRLEDDPSTYHSLDACKRWVRRMVNEYT